MSVIQNLFVPYHQQDEDVYCGAACLQMVLISLGTPVEMLLQDILFNEANSHSYADPSLPWSSGPDGMLWTIRTRNPAPDVHTFFLYVEDAEENISRDIICTIKLFKVAPIALIFDMQHWIVVTGYNVSQEPVGFSDSAYSILGFWIKNPFPVTPRDVQGLLPPPPHWAFDPCGYGDEKYYGNPNQYVGYYEWQTTYMTGVRDGLWKGKFLAICDPPPSPTGLGKRLPVKRYFSGEKIIDKKTAGEYALYELKEHGLTGYEPLEKILSNVWPQEDPVLVHRLDKENDFYYIVPMQSHNNEIRALVCVDARFGNLMQASFATEKGPIIFNLLTREEILDILGKRLELKCENKVLTIYREVVSIYPSLVWRPCKESLSLHIPFYMITIQNYRVFVRMDGQVFTRLTINGRGI
jgi:hypothetical protein